MFRFSKNNRKQRSTVADSCNPSTLETGAGGFPELEAIRATSLGCRVKHPPVPQDPSRRKEGRGGEGGEGNRRKKEGLVRRKVHSEACQVASNG